MISNIYCVLINNNIGGLFSHLPMAASALLVMQYIGKEWLQIQFSSIYIAQRNQSPNML